MKIESVENKQIKLFERLKQKKYRRETQQFVVEGVHLVQLALVQQQVKYLFLTEKDYVVTEDKLYKGDLFIAPVTCPYAYVSEKIVAKLAQTITPQGIFAICSMQIHSYDKTSIVLFDGLQNPGNVGTIIRTAQAFNIHNFYFTYDAVDPYNEKVIRASQGALFFSSLFFETDSFDARTQLQPLNRLYALDIVGKPLTDVERAQDTFGLVVGNEAKGINYERWQDWDLEQITIPMQKEIESLNVAIATSIALYELRR